LYFGAEDLEQRVETDVMDEWAATAAQDIDPDKMAVGRHTAAMTFLINLYILSDKLIDPTTANLVIDKLISFTSKGRYRLSSNLVAHVYASTTEGNPLRMLARDWYMHDTRHTWPLDLPKESWTCLPADFLRDLIVENARCQQAHPEKQVKDVFSDHPVLREKEFYHQKVEKSKAS
jgi:hypothetical protein